MRQREEVQELLHESIVGDLTLNFMLRTLRATLLDALYGCALAIAFPVLAYRRWRQGKSWNDWGAKLTGKVEIAAPRSFRIWLHAVSVGEVNLLAGFVRALEARHPELDMVISSSTSTGLQLARERFGAGRVFPFPYDFSWGIRETFRRIQPQMILLAELEVWPNMIAVARQAGVPVGVINGRMSEASFRGYRRVRWLLRGTFARLAWVAVQDNTYRDRFHAMGVPLDRIHVTGSLKFDYAPDSRDGPEVRAVRVTLGTSAENSVWLAGSTQEGEEEVVLKIYRKLSPRFPHLRLMLVPRHAERFEEVARLVESNLLRVVRYSQLCSPRSDWAEDEVVLGDQMGQLRVWWGIAEIAFVGGSLGDRGGQNMLEPAGYGAAVCFGPNTRNFRQIVERLLAVDGARMVRDAEELEAFIAQMLDQPAVAISMGERARNLVRAQQGATTRTLDLITKTLPSPSTPNHSEDTH